MHLTLANVSLVTEHGELISGRYRLVQPVGQGGMGRVWLGFDETLGRDVAVKEILVPPGLDDRQRESALRRMMREARTAARLNHPGIVTVHDVVEHRGAPVIVMEFVRGQSLAAAVREQGRLSPQRVAEIGSTVLDALSVAHAAGVVHRDLKPDNILLAKGRAVLTDFGIASTADATTALTSAGTVLGTPVYMAPEQLEGQPATAAGDLWSLGATLYAAVEGRPPFSGPTLTSLAVAILTLAPRPVEHAASLAPVLAELLVKDPEQRATAEHTARALAALLPAPHAEPAAPPPRSADPHPATQRTPLAPRPPSRPARPDVAGQDTVTGVAPVRVPQRPAPEAASWPAEPDTDAPPSRAARTLPRRRLLLAGLGVLAAGAVPAAIALNSSGKDKAKENRSGGNGSKGGKEEGVRVSGVALTGHAEPVVAVTFSPDGKTLASGDREDVVRLWDLTTGKSTGTRTDEVSMRGVAFSPDGRTLATSHWGDPTKGDQSGVRLWNVARNGVIEGSFTGHTGIVTCVAFSPDGKTIASGAEDGTVRLWDVAAGRSRRSLDCHAGYVYSVAFSPDGKTLASSGSEPEAGAGARVQLWDVATGKVRGTFPLDGDWTCTSLAFGPDGRTLAGASGKGVELWYLDTGKHLITLDSGKFASAVAFSPDGKQVVSSAGQHLALWNVADRKRTATFIGHSSAVNAVAFSPDGKSVAGGSEDMSVRLWKLP